MIIGSEGQDGTYLRRLLRQKGYAVVGVGSRSVIADELDHYPSTDIRNREDVLRLLRSVQPDQLYYLAAFHHSSEDHVLDSGELVSKTVEVNLLALNNFLGGIASECPDCRLFYAASSLVFGDPPTPIQNEATPLNPICPYGISKVAGMHLCRYYRATHNVYASVGILYNHESPLRSPKFISRKITSAVANISRGATGKLVIGDLDSRVDWGYAPDYVQAMYDILALDEPDVFVVGSGVLHSVLDFVHIAFARAGLDWAQHVIEDQRFLSRRVPRTSLCADSSKVRFKTGWIPTVSFEQMVHVMVDSDMQTSVPVEGAHVPGNDPPRRA